MADRWHVSNEPGPLGTVVASLGRDRDDVDWFVHADCQVYEWELPEIAARIAAVPALLGALEKAERLLAVAPIMGKEDLLDGIHAALRLARGDGGEG